MWTRPLRVFPRYLARLKFSSVQTLDFNTEFASSLNGISSPSALTTMLVDLSKKAPKEGVSFEQKGPILRVCQQLLESNKFSPAAATYLLEALHGVKVRDYGVYDKLVAIAVNDDPHRLFRAATVINGCTLPGMRVLLERLSTAIASRITELDPKLIAGLLSLFAKREDEHVALIAKLCEAAKAQASYFNPWALSSILTALSVLSVCDQTLVAQLCLQARNKISEFKPIDIAIVMSTLPKFGAENADRLLISLLCTEALTRSAEFDPRSISTMLFGMAELGVGHKKLIHQFCLEISKQIDQFGTEDIAKTLSSLGSLEFHNAALLARLWEALSKKPPPNHRDTTMLLFAASRFKPENAILTRLCDAGCNVQFKDVDILRVFQTLVFIDFRHAKLIKHLCALALKHMPVFTPLQLGSIASCLARLDMFDEPLIKRLCQQAITKIGLFTARGLAVLASGLAKLDFKHDELISVMCIRAIKIVESFDQFTISPFLHALAQLGVNETLLTEQFCLQIRKHVALFDQRPLTQLLSDLWQLGFKDLPTVSCICEEAKTKLTKFDTRSLTTMLKAVWRFGLSDPVLVEKVCEQVRRRIKEMNSLNIVQLLHSLSKLEETEKETVEMLCNEALVKASEFRAFETPVVIRALAVLGLYAKDLVTVFCAKLKASPTELTVWQIAEVLHSLFLWRHWNLELYEVLRNQILKLGYKDLTDAECYELIAECNVCLTLEQPSWTQLPPPPTSGADFNPSSRAIESAVAVMDARMERNYVIRGMAVDFALPQDRIALEISSKKDKYRVLKHRLLRQLGWQVQLMPDWKIHELGLAYDVPL